MHCVLKERNILLFPELAFHVFLYLESSDLSELVAESGIYYFVLAVSEFAEA